MRKNTYTYTVDYDQWADSPRNWDNLGLMVLSHKQYDFPNDVKVNFGDFFNWEEVKKHLKKEHKAIHILPVQIYDHSGVRLYVGTTHDRWDGGQVGFVFTTEEQIKKSGQESLTAKEIKKILTGEVDIYSKYVNGEVYFSEVKDENGEVVDGGGCGFYSREEAEECAKSTIARLEQWDRAGQQKALKEKIKHKVSLDKR